MKRQCGRTAYPSLTGQTHCGEFSFAGLNTHPECTDSEHTRPICVAKVQASRHTPLPVAHTIRPPLPPFLRCVCAIHDGSHARSVHTRDVWTCTCYALRGRTCLTFGRRIRRGSTRARVSRSSLPVSGTKAAIQQCHSCAVPGSRVRHASCLVAVLGAERRCISTAMLTMCSFLDQSGGCCYHLATRPSRLRRYMSPNMAAAHSLIWQGRHIGRKGTSRALYISGTSRVHLGRCSCSRVHGPQNTPLE